MTARHGTYHEDLLRQLALGDLPPDAIEVRETLLSCPLCQPRYRRMIRTRDVLDRAARAERRDIAEALASIQPSDVILARRVLHQAWSEEHHGQLPATKRSPSWLLPVSLVASMAALSGLFVFFVDRSGSPAELRPSSPMLLAPTGILEPGEIYSDFRWTDRSLPRADVHASDLE